MTLLHGAGHGKASDAPSQGPAQERLSPQSVQPKPTNSEAVVSDGAPVIDLAARPTKPEAAETVTREAGSLVMTRPKPEKRKNAKQRAQEKYAKAKDAKDGTTPMTATAKSEAETKAKAKAASKAAGKAERKAKRSAAKAASEAA